MATSSVIPSTVQVRLLWTVNGQVAINVLHGIVQGAFVSNQTVANALGVAIKSAVTANLADHMGISSGLVKVGLRDLRTENNVEFLDSGATTLGSAVDDALPANNALCISTKTAKAGASFRGRTYLTGFTEAANANTGTVQSAVAAAGVSFMTAVSAAMTAQQITFAVASRSAPKQTIVKNVFNADGSTSTVTISDTEARVAQSTPVVAILSRTEGWESQRRRSNGRGSAALLALTPVAFQDLTVEPPEPSRRSR